MKTALLMAEATRDNTLRGKCLSLTRPCYKLLQPEVVFVLSGSIRRHRVSERWMRLPCKILLAKTRNMKLHNPRNVLIAERVLSSILCIPLFGKLRLESSTGQTFSPTSYIEYLIEVVFPCDIYLTDNNLAPYGNVKEAMTDTGILLKILPNSSDELSMVSDTYRAQRKLGTPSFIGHHDESSDLRGVTSRKSQNSGNCVTAIPSQF
ncbi:hypothetical protein F5880DRAFT_1069646 [Lentinula raphanica]|nr:hypothetical protein F5880DRAFT_1069646 [Lentinula raphanica]